MERTHPAPVCLQRRCDHYHLSPSPWWLKSLAWMKFQTTVFLTISPWLSCFGTTKESFMLSNYTRIVLQKFFSSPKLSSLRNKWTTWKPDTENYIGTENWALVSNNSWWPVPHLWIPVLLISAHRFCVSGHKYCPSMWQLWSPSVPILVLGAGQFSGLCSNKFY